MEINFTETIKNAANKNYSSLFKDSNNALEFVFEEIFISYATILVMCNRKSDSMSILEDGI